MVTAIDAQIAADVAADPRKPGSDSGYNNARDATVNFVGRRADEIRARISARGF
jgi:hypothetical protein